VRSGGAYVGAIHLVRPPGLAAPPSPFRLERGALREIFAGWKILYDSEGSDPRHAQRAVRIAARRA
jgi:hypothetical protein